MQSGLKQVFDVLGDFAPLHPWHHENRLAVKVSALGSEVKLVLFSDPVPTCLRVSLARRSIRNDDCLVKQVVLQVELVAYANFVNRFMEI